MLQHKNNVWNRVKPLVLLKTTGKWFLKLKAMHHNIIVLQVLERVFNVTFPTAALYTLSNTLKTHNIPLFS